MCSVLMDKLLWIPLLPFFVGKTRVAVLSLLLLAGFEGFWGKTGELIPGSVHARPQPSNKSSICIKEQMKIILPASSDTLILGSSFLLFY